MRLSKRQLRGEFKRFHKMRIIDPDQDSGAPSNAVIDTLNEFARDTLYLDNTVLTPKRVSTPQTFLYPANTPFIPLPSEMRMRRISLMRGIITGNTNAPIPLRSMGVEEFVNFNDQGTPLGYACVGDKLYLRPAPTVGWTLTANFSRGLVVLADGQYPDELPDECHQTIPHLAVINYRGEVNEPVGSQMQATVDEERRLLREIMEELNPDSRRIAEVQPIEDFYD